MVSLNLVTPTELARFRVAPAGIILVRIRYKSSGKLLILMEGTEMHLKTGLLCSTMLLAATAAAETWNGTITDVMCRGKDLTTHTTKCAVTCAKGGYGLVLSDGKFMKLDESGNAMTLTALKKSSKEKDLKAKVTGSMEQDVIKVESVTLE